MVIYINNMAIPCSDLSFKSDYKGWTALHHAAFGGYTRTMRIILDTNVKCTDNVDEDGVGLCTVFRHNIAKYSEEAAPSVLAYKWSFSSIYTEAIRHSNLFPCLLQYCQVSRLDILLPTTKY